MRLSYIVKESLKSSLDSMALIKEWQLGIKLNSYIAIYMAFCSTSDHYFEHTKRVS